MADASETMLQQLQSLSKQLLDELKKISPGMAAALTAVVTATAGAGMMSYKLGFSRPGAHALYTFVATSIVGLLYVAHKYGPSHLYNQMVRLSGGIEMAQIGQQQDAFNMHLSAQAKAGLKGVSSAILRREWQILLIPTILTETDSSDDPVCGSIKQANWRIFTSNGMCSKTLWDLACEEYKQLVDTWCTNDRAQLTPLLGMLEIAPDASVEAYNISVKPASDVTLQALSKIDAVYDHLQQFTAIAVGKLANINVRWDREATTPADLGKVMCQCSITGPSVS